MVSKSASVAMTVSTGEFDATFSLMEAVYGPLVKTGALSFSSRTLTVTYNDKKQNKEKHLSEFVSLCSCNSTTDVILKSEVCDRGTMSSMHVYFHGFLRKSSLTLGAKLNKPWLEWGLRIGFPAINIIRKWENSAMLKTI